MEKTRIAAPAPQGTHEARAVRAGQMASVLEAEARQGEMLVATARALFSGVPAEQGEVHRFG